jgi:hypothetical protein
VGGLFAAWDASMVYRGEERLNTLLDDMNLARLAAKRPPVAYRFRKDIRNADLPMNWVLTRRSLARLNQESEAFAELTRAVQDERARRQAPITGVPVTFQRSVEQRIHGKFEDLPLPTKAGLREKANLADNLSKLYVQTGPNKRLKQAP